MATHANGVNGGVNDGVNGGLNGAPAEYDRHSMLGSLMHEDDDEDIPLLYFHTFPAFWRWLCSWAIPGMGMFCEAYFIFSIGNVKPFFSYQYPACFKNHTAASGCSANLTRGPDYSQILGIICGMVTMGFIGDKIGRKWGSVMTVSIMLVGAILLTANGAGLSGRSFTIMYIVSQFVFGYGVGGEYPMAAGSAAERAEAGGKKKAAKRGMEVVLTFSMQGVGNFTNTGILVLLMVIYSTYRPIYTHPSKGKTSQNYSFNRIDGVWRTSFGLGMIPLIFLIFYRTFRLKESVVWKAAQKNHTTSRGAEFGALLVHFWHRLLATGGTWFLWDFSFYGNKVFQSSFIAILSPNASLFTSLLWTLLNSGCALVGYYFSAFTVDSKYIGRLRIQLFGFLMVAILFYVSAIWYHPLTTKGGIQTFQFVYFFSSFWGQWGPNCTTFLLAGELYPTAVRTSAHGFSAGVAKVGALWAAVWFNYLDNRTKFWLTASFNIGGFMATLLFMPDPLRISLAEVDRRWAYIRSGKVYHGEAIHPKSLSLFERMIGTSKNYDKAKDEEDRWQESMELGGGAAKGGKPGIEMTNNGGAVV